MNVWWVVRCGVGVSIALVLEFVLSQLGGRWVFWMVCILFQIETFDWYWVVQLAEFVVFYI